MTTPQQHRAQQWQAMLDAAGKHGPLSNSPKSRNNAWMQEPSRVVENVTRDVRDGNPFNDRRTKPIL